jgi:RND superfamily putative drug exporter
LGIDKSDGSPLEGIARAIVRFRVPIIIGWAALAVFAVPRASHVYGRLRVEGRSRPTEASEAGQLIKGSFDRPLAKFLVIAVAGPVPIDSEPFHSLLEQLSVTAERQPYVGDVISALTVSDAGLISDDRRATFLVASIDSPWADSATQVVPAFREAVRQVVAALPGGVEFDIQVTGRPALEWDVHAMSVADAKRGERRALIPTAVVLLVAFGAVIAAVLPLTMGVLAMSTALAGVYLVAPFFPMSVFVLPVVTMVGLGVGIDYCLFMITRYREEVDRGADPHEATLRTMMTAGRAVVTSGLTVVIGFGSLIVTGATRTQSVAIGGVFVVTAAVLLATTFLPAVLALLGPWIDWPPVLSRRLRWFRTGAAWARWGRWLSDHRVAAFTIGLMVMAGCSWPLLWLKTGSPSSGWFAGDTESVLGAATVEQIGSRGALIPIRVVFQAPAGQRIVGNRYLGGLRRFSDSIRADPRVAGVRGPVDLRDGMSLLDYLMLYGDLESARERHPTFMGAYVSRDGQIAVMDVNLADSASAATGTELVRSIRKTTRAEVAGLDSVNIMVTGFDAADVDQQDALKAALPIVVGLVVVATTVLLFAFFRSVLVPIKAVVMNGLSVVGALGLMVAVFQEGFGGQLFGRAGPTDAIYPVVPLMVLAVAFGVSMDYEVFLLSRIREALDRTGDNERATVEGIRTTASVITSAAAIMVVVFGSFAFSEVLAAQLMGFGLAAAVFLDATVIRMVLVPAFMQIAGRWNWWPGVNLARQADLRRRRKRERELR